MKKLFPVLGEELADANVAFPPGTAIAAPKILKTKEARAFFRKHAAMLIAFRQLCPADLPGLESLWFTWEKMEEAARAFQAAEPLSEDYDALRDSFLKLSRHFDELGKRYATGPAARSRLALDALSVSKAAREDAAAAMESAVASILLERT